jgi:hypothetical protein
MPILWILLEEARQVPIPGRRRAFDLLEAMPLLPETLPPQGKA